MLTRGFVLSDSPKIIPCLDIPNPHASRSHHVPMDVLGLFSCIFPNWWPLHWEYGPYWPAQRLVGTTRRYSWHCILPLSAPLLRCYCPDLDWRFFWTRTHPTFAALCLFLGYHSILPCCLLDLWVLVDSLPCFNTSSMYCLGCIAFGYPGLGANLSII